ncbi:tRNA (guanosine(37)-N1)-methyltransferase TrmD [Buchnera aphidicola (Formosaphis micheliae)]|uniref:tRNA (guanosine(37)-N1)-methyltransferase TrmD n=1 Tax=Buchnera aphidicola TaxID=9 RepID=UPI0031CCB4EE
MVYFNIISIFPEIFSAIKNQGIISKAIKKGIIHLNIFNPRDYTHDKYRTIDDRPYGGGSGMLMKFEPLLNAIKQAKKIKNKVTKIIYLSPKGKPLNQKNIIKLAKINNFIIVCGRYKGIDDRLISHQIDEEWSIGDYVVTGGELPAMIFIDALSRLIPGVIGNQESIEEDSFYNGLLDAPQFTRPKNVLGMSVPKILLSGHHEKIKQWKIKKSLGITWLKRPDLLNKLTLTKKQTILLTEFKQEWFKTIKNKFI